VAGHIALGNVGALRDYMIANTDLYSKAPANQFAAKLATGAGDYDDLQNWSYWVMDNWQMGVGQKDAEAGGFLYGECETRYPGQVLLPRHLRFEMSDSATVHDADASWIADELTIGTGQTYQKWAMKIGGGAGRTLSAIWVYLKNNGQTFTIRLSGDTAGAPGTSITTCTVTSSSETPGYAWYKASTISQSITSANYWLSLEVASTGTLPAQDDSAGGPEAAYYNGSAWQSSTSVFGLLLNVEAYGDSNALPRGNVQLAEFNGRLYAVNNTATAIYYRDEAGPPAPPGWTAAVGSAKGTQILALGDYLYIALDTAAASASNMNVSETVTGFTVPDGGAGEVAHLAQWGGFLWAGYGQNVFYTSTPAATGAQWTGPIVIGFDGELVTGIAGLGDYVYVSTEKELVYVGFGDEVQGVTVWGSPSARNGLRMLHYQGQIFIPLQESLIRYDGSAMLPVGIDLGEGLPADLQGNVAALTSTNNWLLMAVNPRDGTTEGATVWAWTTQGWHHIAHLPPTMSIASLYYRRSNQRLYIGASTGHVFSLYLPDVAQVVDVNDPEFAPVGWMETDWFFGGLKEVEKDFESVYVSGEDFNADQYVNVYWKDDASTAWELLGTVTSDRQELRWSDYDTRPQSRQLKIGLEIHTDTPGVSPLIRAVRVKYHPMVSDWFRWSFPILCSNNQQELGGMISTYNANQKRSHLDTLITQVPPFIFRDMDGVQYECKVMGCAIQNDDVEWYNGEIAFNSIYNMTIEQIRNGAYTA